MSEPYFFEDLELGQSWRTASRTITEADVTSFAGISGDFNPIHVDAEHAASTEFGERVVHGALVLAVATGLRQQQGAFRGSLKAWVGMREWRFQAPVRFGDTIHVVTEIVGRRETSDPSTGLVEQEVQVRNQLHDLVASGIFVTLMHRRPSRVPPAA